MLAKWQSRTSQETKDSIAKKQVDKIIERFRILSNGSRLACGRPVSRHLYEWPMRVYYLSLHRFRLALSIWTPTSQPVSSGSGIFKMYSCGRKKTFTITVESAHEFARKGAEIEKMKVAYSIINLNNNFTRVKVNTADKMTKMSLKYAQERIISIPRRSKIKNISAKSLDGTFVTLASIMKILVVYETRIEQKLDKWRKDYSIRLLQYTVFALGLTRCRTCTRFSMRTLPGITVETALVSGRDGLLTEYK